MKIAATLPLTGVRNAKNLSGEKELVRGYQLVAIVGGKLLSLGTAKVWYSRSPRATVAYASVWIGHGAIYTSGHGTAGGGGYHKPSAALHSAIRSAGVSLNKDIGGVGDDAMIDALVAIGKALVPKAKTVEALVVA